MELFVNREHELELIDESFNALLDRKRLLRTPIIEFQGVGGIGKTSLLKQVEQRCQDTQLPFIWIDMGQDASTMTHEIISQAKKYAPKDETTLERSATQATRVLLEEGPVVMLFDSVDTAGPDQLNLIESLLKELIDHEKLFVVLASKRVLLFQQERSVARKLTTWLLQSLDRKNCELYCENQEYPIDPEVRNLIFEWTRGYPLAMNVMTQAVTGGHDPRTEEGRKAILDLFTERIINGEVLANVLPEEQARYQSALQLLAVPRRFNLPIMQDLIETFLPEQKRESSLAYFPFPKEINDAAAILNWNMSRGGFSVDEPIRTIFLLLLKNEESQRYFAIHDFLAQTNLRLARELSGSDRVRHVRECLYHTASNTSSPALEALLAQALDLILQEPLELFQQFSEEFSQDEELKEALGSHLNAIQTKLIEHQTTMNSKTTEEKS
jgi:hypothetical protein